MIESRRKKRKDNLQTLAVSRREQIPNCDEQCYKILHHQGQVWAVYFLIVTNPGCPAIDSQGTSVIYLPYVK